MRRCTQLLKEALVRGGRSNLGAAAEAQRGAAAEAQRAYCRAVRIFMLQYGPSHINSTSSAKNLFDAQEAMQSQGTIPATARDVCNFCGSLRLDGQAVMMCGKCKAVGYCCKEHQATHWPLHKKACRVPGG